jgi:hypothetical protein
VDALFAGLHGVSSAHGENVGQSSRRVKSGIIALYLAWS